MNVTLNVQGPPRVIVLALSPDDNAVKLFRDTFLNALQSAHLVANLESHSWCELRQTLRELPTNYVYNSLLIVTHGTENHNLTFQDPDLPANSDAHNLLGNPSLWARYLGNAFDDRLLLFAACHSGDELNAQPLLHTGMALHFLAPDPNTPKLKAILGAKAMAAFINILGEKGAAPLAPDDFVEAETRVNKDYPCVLKLWPYKAPEEFIARIGSALQAWLKSNRGSP